MLLLACQATKAAAFAEAYSVPGDQVGILPRQSRTNYPQKKSKLASLSVFLINLLKKNWVQIRAGRFPCRVDVYGFGYINNYGKKPGSRVS
jgi:hypothetical protein